MRPYVMCTNRQLFVIFLVYFRGQIDRSSQISRRKQSCPINSSRLHVSNIPFRYRERDLYRLMQVQYGSVVVSAWETQTLCCYCGWSILFLFSCFPLSHRILHSLLLPEHKTWVGDHYVGKPSAGDQPTRPTQPFSFRGR